MSTTSEDRSQMTASWKPRSASPTALISRTTEVRGKNHRGYCGNTAGRAEWWLFDFGMGREREGPRRFLDNFEGVLQSDGYTAYGHTGAPTSHYDSVFGGLLSDACNPLVLHGRTARSSKKVQNHAVRTRKLNEMFPYIYLGERGLF
jgi:hypothetical protein